MDWIGLFGSKSKDIINNDKPAIVSLSLPWALSWAVVEILCI